MLIREPGLAECGRRKGIRGEGGVRKPWTKETTRKEVCLKKQKKVDEKAHDGAATPRVVLLLLLLSRSSSGERQRQYIYIYIYTLGATKTASTLAAAS